MKYLKLLLVFTIATLLVRCGNKEEYQNEEPTTTTSPQKKDTIFEETFDSIKATKESIFRSQSYKRKKAETEVLPLSEEKIAAINSSFILKKILDDCVTGKTFTQEELSDYHNIPKDAIKLIKSITKISSDEVVIKWKSTWFIEQLSDAKFKDGNLKVHFKGNKMYTSGNAIGIKYKRKLYTDLIITGDKVRIPSVTDFYWIIGK